MANHYKPSKEELAANAQAALDSLENNPPEPKPSEPAPSEPAPSEPEIPEPKPSEPAPSEPAPSEPAPSPAVDYKKRYSDSSREAMIIASKNKELNKAVEDAASIPEPTDEELQTEYPEWQDMSANEQRLAKDNLLNKKRFSLIHDATAKFKQLDEWSVKVDTFIDDPKNLAANPELNGKQEEFKIFATKPTRRGVDFEDLVLAFFGEQAKNRPAPKKGKMFETGSGGRAAPAPKPDDGKISAAEGRLLMKNDYTKFKELLKAGKIRNE